MSSPSLAQANQLLSLAFKKCELQARNKKRDYRQELQQALFFEKMVKHIDKEEERLKNQKRKLLEGLRCTQALRATSSASEPMLSLEECIELRQNRPCYKENVSMVKSISDGLFSLFWLAVRFVINHTLFNTQHILK